MKVADFEVGIDAGATGRLERPLECDATQSERWTDGDIAHVDDRHSS
jgi:hypothetical protein